MAKKIIIITALIFIISLGIGAYYIFVKKPVQAPQEDVTATGSLPVDSTANPLDTSGISISNSSSTALAINISQNPLVQLATQPVSGATTITSKAGTVVRFGDRASGNIFDVDLATGSVTRISNTTIPKIYESLWLGGGNKPILRYIDTDGSLATYSGELVAPSKNSTSTLETIKGRFLMKNIDSIAASPDGKKIFYLTSTTDGSQGFISNPDGSSKVQLFSSPLREWLAAWPEANTITITTKPSAIASGFIYMLNAKSGSMTKVVGDIYGLSALLNPSATEILYTDMFGNLTAMDLKTKAIVDLGTKTYADKCVWSKQQKHTVFCGVPTTYSGNILIDDWYMGATQFKDDIYAIHTDTGTKTLTSLISAADTIDVVNPTLSSNENYLIFTNKNDLGLWSLTLKTATSTKTQ